MIRITPKKNATVLCNVKKEKFKIVPGMKETNIDERINEIWEEVSEEYGLGELEEEVKTYGIIQIKNIEEAEKIIISGPDWSDRFEQSYTPGTIMTLTEIEEDFALGRFGKESQYVVELGDKEPYILGRYSHNPYIMGLKTKIPIIDDSTSTSLNVKKVQCAIEFDNGLNIYCFSRGTKIDLEKYKSRDDLPI